jgi:hypothetical protein
MQPVGVVPANRCAELAKEASPPFLAEIYRKVSPLKCYTRVRRPTREVAGCSAPFVPPEERGNLAIPATIGGVSNPFRGSDQVALGISLPCAAAFIL